MKRRKIAIIGWDSVTFDVVLPLIEQGALPVLAGLMARGVWGNLLSTIHPLSPTAWSSFMTGMNPGKHGIFDFVTLNEQGRFHFTNGAALRRPTLWSRLGTSGYTVGVVNVPMTYPPAAVNGYLLAGMDAPPLGRDITHPPQLLGEIEARVGPYRVHVPARGYPWQSVERFTDKYVEMLCENARQQGEIGRWLVAEKGVDFLTLVFTAPDRVQHALGHLLAGRVTPDDGIGRVYQACDAATGRILEVLDDDWMVIVLSDHGASAYTRTFDPNRWLAEQSYLHMRAAPAPSPWEELTGPVRRRLARWLGRPIPQKPELERFMERVQWDQTRAFGLGAFGSIYIATRDRFPQGSVDPGAEYRALCDEITDGLLAVRDPQTSAPIVRQVRRREDVYSGQVAHLAPDLLLDLDDDFFVRSNLDQTEGQLTGAAGRYRRRSLAHTGKHTMEGIVVAAGGSIVAAGRQPEAHIEDLAPTALYLAGLAVPAQMDGRPLTDWFDPDHVAMHPVDIVDEADVGGLPAADGDYSARDAALVERQLRNLGYLN